MNLRAEAWFEISVDHRGSNYLVIFGEHINGGWCAIPNWGISCEMSDPTDTFFNQESLEKAGISSGAAKAIALAIRQEAQRQNRTMHFEQDILRELGLLPKEAST